jgi:hypothetical protein
MGWIAKLHLSPLPQKHSMDLISPWKTENLLGLEPTLIAKLPYIKHSFGKKNKEIIIVHQDLGFAFPFNPITLHRKDKVKAPVLEGIRKEQETTKQPSDLDNFIQSVDRNRKRREIESSPVEITSPYHVTSFQGPSAGAVRFVDVDAKIRPKKGEKLIRVNTTESRLPHPIATSPFCIGRRSASGRLYPWRETQKQVKIWESLYAPKTIHQNYRSKSAMVQEESKSILKDKRFIKTPITYKYPNRFLDEEEPLRLVTHSRLDRDEASKNLDFLLNLSELKYNQRINQDRLDTAIERETRKEERYRRKMQVESKEADQKLIRKLYHL